MTTWGAIREATASFIFYDVYFNECKVASDASNARLQAVTADRERVSSELDRSKSRSTHAKSESKRRKHNELIPKYEASLGQLDFQFGLLTQQANEKNAKLAKISESRTRALNGLEELLHAFRPERIITLLNVTDMTSLRMFKKVNELVVRFKVGKDVSGNMLESMRRIGTELGIHRLSVKRLYEMEGGAIKTLSRDEAGVLGFSC